ncbi:AfsR/SARP family transcriptional regulator [Actinoplanes sp. RD1]|uniref:AfsR/SARP family transcriptional regulator n=1 Tax=Actinoplanes sp. RD1 TaxID=3064538 RepID=UPI002740C262|nr:BTAD domain-containing putative transcriptional regulator [Actinoplanes sp. RD1]
MLGELTVHGPGGRIALGAGKQRTALALLLVRAGTVVPDDDLVDELWPDRPPASAAANLRQYAANLRRVLPPGLTIARTGPGYRLDVPPEVLDVRWFRERMTAARASAREGVLDAALAAYDDALAVWRGPALADVSGGPVLTAWRVALHEERLGALDDRTEALLAAGVYDRAAMETTALLAEEPLRERTHAQLMRARYGSGDTSGALTAYRDARDALARELGVEPGEELRRLQRAVLDRDAGALLPRLGAGRDDAVPRQLPAGLAGFRGRSRQLAFLDGLLDRTRQPTGPVVAALFGTAGAGKTTLALHWAHRARDRFPDGQLHLDLRGYEPHAGPLDVADGLRSLLTAVGVPPQRMPVDVDGRSALLRTVLSGRRVLLLLDNARDAGQVRPLLPGTPGSLVLITSRPALAPLVVAGAHPVRVGPVSTAEATELIEARLGADRVAAEPAAVGEIVASCANLPLALAVVAARAAIRPELGLSALATELRGSPGALATDGSGELSAAFSWSYRQVSGAAARLFRLLGLHPVAEFGLLAAASAAGLPVADTARLIGELRDAELLSEPAPGRYAAHDLLRVYAYGLAHQHDSAADRAGAIGRLLDHYLLTAYAAALVINPVRAPLRPPPASPVAGVTVAAPATLAEASAWFERELPALLAAAAIAAATGRDRHTWQLPWSLTEFLDRRGHWEDAVTCFRAAIGAAHRLGDHAAEAESLRCLARAQRGLGDPEAYASFGRATRLFEELGDLPGAARTQLGRALTYQYAGDFRSAVRDAAESLERYRSVGHQAGIGASLNALGFYRAQLGEYEEARRLCAEALTHCTAAGYRSGMAAALDSRGHIEQLCGRHEEALRYRERSLVLFREIGDRWHEADVLTCVGDNHRALGRPAAAARAWREAFEIFRDLRHPDADKVAARLDEFDG